MRIYDRWILKLLPVLMVAACAAIQGRPAPRQRIDPGLATLGGGFVSGTEQANGTNLHYVRGGAGPAVILLHGFPEDWVCVSSHPLDLASREDSLFEKLMPRFAKALRDHGCANVKIEVIKNSVHYVADEQTEALAQLIERYASFRMTHQRTASM